MKKCILSLVCFFSFLVLSTEAWSQTNNCMMCHQAMEDASGPSQKIVKDVHHKKGLSCFDCHGGDPKLEDMEQVRQSEGFLGVPTHEQVPEFCARCHSDPGYMKKYNPSLPTDQLEKYKTSKHGKLLFPKPVEDSEKVKKPDTKVANCVSCHGVHDITDSKTPTSRTHAFNLPETCGKCHANESYMKAYDIPTNQLKDFVASVHGQALLKDRDTGAPACNDCHGNHGATPPGLMSIPQVCGNCHAMEMDYFNQSPHKKAYEENGFEMCEFCHSNHKVLKPQDDWIGVGDKSLCIQCHSEDDGTKGIAVAKGMHKAIMDMVAGHQKAKETLTLAGKKGMYTEDDEFLLKEANESITKSRSLVHTFTMDKLTAESNKGMKAITKVQENAKELLQEHRMRRYWWVLASLCVLGLAGLVYWKIRQIEK